MLDTGDIAKPLSKCCAAQGVEESATSSTPRKEALLQYNPHWLALQQLKLRASSRPAGLSRAWLPLLEPGLDGNFAVITSIFFTCCSRKGNPRLFFFLNLIEDTIKHNYAGVGNKNTMEGNIQSFIITSYWRGQQCVTAPRPPPNPPPWLALL